MAVVLEGRILFAKNSDRDANEGQNIEWHDRQQRGDTVRCTHIEIPNVPETNAIMISSPFWIWGAEMGTNEHGLTIGNEAVFTKTAKEPEPGLIGMDLLRLALERCATATEALETIRELLETYGQGGRCGHEDPRFTYDNSFIVADTREAYVLETAGRATSVEKITGARSISNGLTIPEFAAEHSDFLYTKFSGAHDRQSRTQKLCESRRTVSDMMEVLRDHGGIADPTYHFVNGGLRHPCVHAGGAVTSSQSTSSWVAELSPDAQHHWVTATSAPCTGIFKPVAVDEPIDYGNRSTDVADDSLWWRHEALHRRVMMNPGELGPMFQPERVDRESRWLTKPPKSADAFAEAGELLAMWTHRVAEEGVDDLRPFWTRRYWRERNSRANLPF